MPTTTSDQGREQHIKFAVTILINHGRNANYMQRLTEPSDPAPGMFSLQMDPSGANQYTLLWNNSIEYWASGNWTGDSFTGVPEMSPASAYPNSAYTFQFIDNDQEVSFMYNVTDDALLTRNVIDMSGQTQAWVWVDAAQAWVLYFSQPKLMCGVYGICGAYSKCSSNAVLSCTCLKGFSESPRNGNPGNQTAGCRRNVPLQCGHGDSAKVKNQEGFYMIGCAHLPDKAQGTDAANVHSCWLAQNFLTQEGRNIGIGIIIVGLTVIIPDTTTVAVKRLEGLCQGEKEFRAEVSTIGKIHHKNLIRLLGFCCGGSKKLLVYEYMPNGSLDQHLFGKSNLTLSWSTRYQITVGIAKGLAYLHEGCRDCIIHCDIKPQNILINESLAPKVADFGLSKLIGHDFSRVLTSMRGTLGYLAPEWLSGQAITSKADVFSYGMMLFEIISGKRNIEHGASTSSSMLIAEEIPKGGEVHRLFDPELVGDANPEELARVFKVACWCIQNHPDCRPSMREIIQILEGLKPFETPPVPRYLKLLADGQE
uniref:Protein kinase domain-containing protein n=1 Tax=Oryza rufipogon TaxID=4529 RepID=A0A0E0N630_ORYRU